MGHSSTGHEGHTHTRIGGKRLENLCRKVKNDESSIYTYGLGLKDTLRGRLAIPDPDATKPKHKRRKDGK